MTTACVQAETHQDSDLNILSRAARPHIGHESDVGPHMKVTSEYKRIPEDL